MASTEASAVTSGARKGNGISVRPGKPVYFHSALSLVARRRRGDRRGRCPRGTAASFVERRWIPPGPGHSTPACDVCQCDDELTESGPGPDRESASMTASGVVRAFCAALSRYGDLSLSPGRVLDGIAVSEGCTIPVDTDELASMGISIHHVRCACKPGDVSHKGGHFCPRSFASDLIRACDTWPVRRTKSE